MSMKKVGSIEVYELDENLDKYTRKEREEYINELFKQEYQGKEISYLLNGEEIKALINQKTRRNFRAYQHSGKYETKKSYNARQNIAFSGNYIDMISNTSYNYSKAESKVHQKRHHKNNRWHYFNKIIKCNNCFYSVNIDVLEKDNNYFIYNTKLKEVDAPALNRSMISTSSVINIS